MQNHEFGEFERFNSPASENGLGGTMIWLNGSFENVSTVDLDADGIPVKAYIAVFTDEEGHQWLAELDLDYFTEIEKYTDIEGHTLCLCGSYEGYSEVYAMPVFLMEKVFDQKTGNMMFSPWFENAG